MRILYHLLDYLISLFLLQYTYKLDDQFIMEARKAEQGQVRVTVIYKKKIESEEMGLKKYLVEKKG